MNDNANATKQEVLRRLLARRKAIQASLDDILSSPQSYSIQGSYSQTSQDAEKLQREIARIDAAIQAIGSGPSFLKKSYPRYVDP